ncbi:MAG: hypothetical protein H0T92_03955 [Pyrinomonadaceae bacterium]|nr:hypothetical protein [Pyrinomonadaceae bacterium]
MKITLTFLMLLVATTTNVYAQGKGVDDQNNRIRDAGRDRTPGTNGTKQDTGTGRGINFGKGRTATVPIIPNPYRFTARRDAIIEAAQEVMRDRKMILDTAASKPDEGIFISQPYTFSRGAVITETEMNRYAQILAQSARNWTRGRYTMIIEVQPIDGVNTNVSVNARVEGRIDSVISADWLTLQSSGTAEQEFLGALIEKITGESPLLRPR